MKRTVANFVFAVLLGSGFDVSCTRGDTIYVTTTVGIQEFDTTGGTGSVFSAGGWGAMALSPDGVLYAAGQNNTIYRFDSSGNATLFANSGLNFPFGLVFDSNGNLFALNAGDNSIEEFDSRGTGSVFATASSGLDFPESLTFGSNGDLYVASAGNDTIEKFGTNGVGSVFASTGLNNPQGLAFDSSGNLYVANYGNNTIEKFNASGIGSTFASYSTNGVGEYLQAPIGLTFDSSGNLYVANHFTASILQFNPDGLGSLFASGLGNAVFLLDEVPEPSSLLLVGLGVCGLAVWHRRR